MRSCWPKSDPAVDKQEVGTATQVHLPQKQAEVAMEVVQLAIHSEAKSEAGNLPKWLIRSLESQDK